MKNLDFRGWATRAGAAGLALTTIAAAASGSGLAGVAVAMNNICGQLMGILPPLSMLLVVLAAVFYASGKLVPNPEFAGRASGLAAAAIAAAVICIVIVLLMPSILVALYGHSLTCGSATFSG
ncbi:Uncharacterised protein [uncultured archaeon]|nr:Uncharacterised protein [uncultured archaeon]